MPGEESDDIDGTVSVSVRHTKTLNSALLYQPRRVGQNQIDRSDQIKLDLLSSLERALLRDLECLVRSQKH